MRGQPLREAAEPVRTPGVVSHVGQALGTADEAGLSGDNEQRCLGQHGDPAKRLGQRPRQRAGRQPLDDQVVHRAALLLAQLKQAGVGRFGSGWAWLVLAGGKLQGLNTANQDETWNAEWKFLAFVDESALVASLPIIISEWRVVG